MSEMEGIVKRPKRKVKIKADTPIELPKKLKADEMTKLLNCIMENGHKNFDLLQECLPNRNIASIKTFLRTVYDNAGKLCEGHPNLDAWINLAVSKSPYEAAWRDSLQIAQVLKYLSVDGLLENHPLPECCGGINFAEAYRLIYQALMGYPIQPVSTETVKFVQETIIELSNEVRERKDVIRNVNSFLIEKFKPLKVEDVPVKKENPVVESANSSNNSNIDTQVKKPMKVYQRKRPYVDTKNPPSLKIIVEASASNRSTTDLMQDYSVTISGKDSQATVVNVPVPIKISSQLRENPDEEKLLQSTSYNPFQIPGKWLEEPVFVNLLQKH